MQTYKGTTELYLIGSRALLIRTFETGDCSSIYIRKRCRPGRTTSSPENEVQFVIAPYEGYHQKSLRTYARDRAVPVLPDSFGDLTMHYQARDFIALFGEPLVDHDLQRITFYPVIDSTYIFDRGFERYLQITFCVALNLPLHT